MDLIGKSGFVGVFCVAERTPYANAQFPPQTRSRLFRLAAVLSSWNTALHTFSLGSKRQLCTLSHQARKDLAKCSMCRQVFNVSPSVQCVAKYRRSQMSIPKSGRPHMAGLLMTQKIRWQNCYITSKMLYCYMSDDCICNRQYLSMCLLIYHCRMVMQYIVDIT